VMTAEQAHRYSLVDLEVTGHQPYGVLFRTSAGTPGFVDKADIADSAITREDWPSVGQRRTGVVLGLTRSGKLRASMRPADIGLVRSVDDAERTLIEWARIRDQGFADSSERDAFFASPEAAAILKWALCQREFSTDRDRALEILSEAPERLRIEVGDRPSCD